jgi:hypothetical protein
MVKINKDFGLSSYGFDFETRFRCIARRGCKAAPRATLRRKNQKRGGKLLGALVFRPAFADVKIFHEICEAVFFDYEYDSDNEKR